MRTHQQGELVAREFDAAHGVLCVRSGHGVARAIAVNGDTPYRAACVVGSGFVLGLPELFTRAVPRVELQALGPMRTCFTPHAMFEEAFEAHPRVSHGVMATLAEITAAMQRKMSLRCGRPADARLVDVLLELRDGFGTTLPNGGVQIHVPLTRRELAEIAGVAPETVSRVVASLHERGICTFDGRDATIEDVDRALDLALGEE